LPTAALCRDARVSAGAPSEEEARWAAGRARSERASRARRAGAGSGGDRQLGWSHGTIPRQPSKSTTKGIVMMAAPIWRTEKVLGPSSLVTRRSNSLPDITPCENTRSRVSAHAEFPSRKRRGRGPRGGRAHPLSRRCRRRGADLAQHAAEREADVGHHGRDELRHVERHLRGGSVGDAAHHRHERRVHHRVLPLARHEAREHRGERRLKRPVGGAGAARAPQLAPRYPGRSNSAGCTRTRRAGSGFRRRGGGAEGRRGGGVEGRDVSS